jgi:transcriptional regulator of arginine metabolism
MKSARRFIVAKRAAISSNARRALVVSLIQKGLVHSQSDLVELLDDEGIEVTQATASRDLEEVGAVRVKDEKGEMRYLLLDGGNQGSNRVAGVSEQLVLNMEVSGNLVVVRTPPGGAQLFASSLDRAAAKGVLPSLIGTIAGDDTVLVISRSANGGKALANEIQKFTGGSGAGNLNKGNRKPTKRARR